MKKRAMSLVEIMIGVILLAALVLPSLNVIISQSKTVTATRDHTSAAYIAQKIQETYRSFQFSMLEESKYPTNSDEQKQTFEWLLKNEDEFKKHVVNGITYLIEEVEIDPITGINDTIDATPSVYAFAFTVNYTSKDGRSHSLKIHTALARRE